ncbi:flippase [Xanthobacter aminoxidans]|uniref:flippase n=1 Tax=Xanthobacter aminoxidans TaxID=186280 RepID=UPI00372675A1
MSALTRAEIKGRLPLKLFTNIAILYVWQVGVYLVPLIVVPYLSRTLGVEQFGLLGTATGFVAYALAIVDWGFNYTATKQISQNRHDLDKIIEIFWDVVFAKVFLAVITLTIINIALFQFHALPDIKFIILFLELQIIGGMLNFDWLLRGLERMGWFAVVSLAGRLTLIPLTFLFVKSPSDTWIAAAAQGISTVISGIAAMILISRIVRVTPVRFSPHSILTQLKDGVYLFLSTTAINVYVQSSVFLVGLASTPTQAGLYAGADRIKKAGQGLIGPISGALYPRISNLFVHERKSLRRTVLLFLVIQGAFTLCISLAMYFFAEHIVQGFLGPEFTDAIPVVKLLSPVPFLVGIANVLGTNLLIPLGYNKTFMAITLSAGLFSFVSLLLLSSHFGAIGAAAAITTCEGLIAIATSLTSIRIFKMLR